MSWSKKDYCLTAFLILLACIPALYLHSDSEFLKGIACPNFESNFAGFVETITPYLSSGPGAEDSKPVQNDEIVNNSGLPPPDQILASETGSVPGSPYLVNKIEQDEEVLASSQLSRSPIALQSKFAPLRHAAKLVSAAYQDTDISECEDNPDCGKHKKKGVVLAAYDTVLVGSKSGCDVKASYSRRRRRAAIEVEAHAAESKGRGRRRRRRSTASEEAVAAESKASCSKRRRRVSAPLEDAITMESKARCSRRRRRRAEMPADGIAIESRAARRKRPRRLSDEDPFDNEYEECCEVPVAGKYEETSAASIEEVLGTGIEEGSKLEFCNVMDIFTSKDADTEPQQTHYDKANGTDEILEVEEEEEEEPEIAFAMDNAEIPAMPKVSHDEEYADDDTVSDEGIEVESELKEEMDEDSDADEEEDDTDGQHISYMVTPPMYA